jgi:ASC-1-like (ASCH) protein
MSVVVEVPYFHFKQIKEGNSNYLLLINHGQYTYIKELRKFVIRSTDHTNNVVTLNVQKTNIYNYESTTRAIEMEGLRRLSPHLTTLDTVSKVNRYYKTQISTELENIFGVIVVKFKII